MSDKIGAKAAAKLWDDFVAHMNQAHPLKGPTRDTTTPYVNFIGSIDRYKKIFIAAHSEKPSK